MSGALLVRGARQLLTLRGSGGPRRGPALKDLGLIEDGAVLIRQGLIVSVGPSRRVENLKDARQAEEIDATGRLVMPGFVDCHTHLICGPWRLTDREGEPSGGEPAGNASLGVRLPRGVSTRRLELEARRRIGSLIRHGTVAVEARTGYGQDERGELRILRAAAALQDGPLDVIPTYQGLGALPAEFASRCEDYVEWVCSHMLPLVRRRRLARFVDAACPPGVFRPEQVQRYLVRAAELGFRLKVHAGQFAPDGLARLAVELGAVSADHLVHVSREEIAALAASDTVAVLLPGAVFQAGSERYPPARQLIEAGAVVALASGFSPGGCATYSMPMVVALACARMGMTPAEAVAAATINAAHALGGAGRLGSIEPGKQADLVLFDVADYREIPYHFGVNLTRMVIKRGAILYRQGDILWEED